MRGMLVCVLVMLSFFVCAQSDSSRYLGVAVNRTTSVVFPANIVSVDRGSEKIIVQKAISNILRVKAESVFTDTTSLTVITSDGKLYSFFVRFDPAPSNLTIQLASNAHVDRDTALDAIVKNVLPLKQSLYGISVSEGFVRLSLLGIYATGEKIVCRFRLENNSSLSYALGTLKVLSKDLSAGTRRATQERMLVPLLSYNPDMVIREKASQVFVIILPKPSLHHSRSLEFLIPEKDGERNLLLKVRNKHLLKAILLN